MLHYTNIQRIDNMPFEDYLNLPGYSHSFLKRERNGVAESLTMTDNIMIGSLVDAILTDPAKADMSHVLYGIARQISAEIKLKFGHIIKHFKKQVSYTGNICFGDFVMPVKGRLDFLLEGIAVVDLKITKSKDIDGLIEFMGYKNQMWHYCRFPGITKSYLIIYSIPLKQTFIKYIDCSNPFNQFWADKVVMFGKAKVTA